MGRGSPSEETDSEEEPPSPPPAPPPPPPEGGKLGVLGGPKEGGSTETSRDGDGSDSEGDPRVMDEDIMVESGEA